MPITRTEPKTVTLADVDITDQYEIRLGVHSKSRVARVNITPAEALIFAEEIREAALHMLDACQDDELIFSRQQLYDAGYRVRRVGNDLWRVNGPKGSQIGMWTGLDRAWDATAFHATQTAILNEKSHA